MAYNKSSPGIYEQNAAKHTLAYAIWNGLMDRAEISDDTDALEALHRSRPLDACAHSEAMPLNLVTAL
jgi:hypothetical protein